jgi:sucrose-phosphate synthase
LSKELGIPQVHTGHSLGKPKMQRIGVNEENFEQIDQIYHFTERIRVEQETFEHATRIIVSTDQERREQYGMYDINVDDGRFVVCAPGIDVEKFHHYTKEETESDIKARERLQSLFKKELKEPNKPIIYSLSRLDHRKNLPGLIKAYGMDKGLHEIANLLIVAGKIDKIHELGEEAKGILKEMNSLINEYNIQENVCLPESVDFETEVPELYRMIAKGKGVFVNPAFTEPFGITIIEAAASGIPVVSTNNGGPQEIVTNGENGFLVDVMDPNNMGEAIRKLLIDKALWEKFSKKGSENVIRRYTWAGMALKEVEIFKQIIHQ